MPEPALPPCVAASMPAKCVESPGDPTERVRYQFARALRDALPSHYAGAVPMDVVADAVEFLIEPFGDHVVRNAIGQAIARSRAAVAHEDGLRARRACYASLTPRDRETMALVVSGLLTNQIAAERDHRDHGESLPRPRHAQGGVQSLAELVRVAAALDVPLVAHA
jgi:DNA-binding CsgD family transcriptional regulator